MKTKSFKGLIADGDTEQIRLSTNNGLTGYKITKFELFPYAPGGSGTDSEHTVQIWSVDPETVDIVTSFNAPQLLAAGMMAVSSSGVSNPSILHVVFDNVTINQDIFICHKDSTASAEPINYYIELEQVKLDLNEATVATLKDMRGRE